VSRSFVGAGIGALGCWCRSSHRHGSRSVLSQEAGTILLSGPLGAMASFGTPRGHSLCLGTSRRTQSDDERITMPSPQ